MLVLWTEEDLARLKELWKTELSAREIAKEFPGRTKNAVIGAAYRFDLPMRQNPKRGKLAESAPRVRRKRPVQQFPRIPRLPPKAIPPLSQERPEGGVSLMEAQNHHCRAIIGASDDPRSFVQYCGAQVVDGQSFCPYHYAQYTRPRTVR